MSRILQSCIFAHNRTFLYGCEYCRYSYECLVNNNKIDYRNHNLPKLRNKLKDLTGVYLETFMYSNLEDNFNDNVSIQKLYPDKYKEIKKLFSEIKKC